jgi:hypothetical protein
VSLNFKVSLLSYITVFLNRLVQLELTLETFIGFLVSEELTAHSNSTPIPSMRVQNGTYRVSETTGMVSKTTGMAYPITCLDDSCDE